MKIIFLRILNKIGVLRFFNFNTSISVNKKKLKLPILETVGYSNLFMTDLWMVDLLKILFKIDDKKIIDVGINIGQTLLKIKSTSAKTEYLGFEPNLICLNYVNRLIKVNNFEQTTIIPVGISDETQLGQLHFFNTSNVDSSASIVKNFRPAQKIFKKEYIPLLNVKKIRQNINLDSISLIKIDVEGSELEVINSFTEVIEQSQPILIVEILPAYDKRNVNRVKRQNEIQMFLSDQAYSMFRMQITNQVLTGYVEIDHIEIHDNMNNCEYVFVPKTKIIKFKNHFNEWLDEKYN